MTVPRVTLRCHAARHTPHTMPMLREACTQPQPPQLCPASLAAPNPITKPSCPAQRWARCLPHKPKLCRIFQEEPGAGASVAEPRTGLSSTGAPCSQPNRACARQTQAAGVGQAQNPAKRQLEWGSPPRCPLLLPTPSQGPTPPPPHTAAPRSAAFPGTASPLRSEQVVPAGTK